MYDSQPALQGGERSATSKAQQTASLDERVANEQICELLRVYGLRTSLIRLKVIDAVLEQPAAR